MIDIRIDTSSLTYTQFLIPELSSEFVEGADAPVIRLEPGMYGFQQKGSAANFRFEVTPGGLIDYDIANEEFLDGRGTSTLTVRGFTVTLDARPLSHDLLPLVVGATTLSRDRTHELTLVPAAGYGFQPAGGSVADFHFAVDVDGEVVVDPRYAGFATASGRTLTINGYRITIDGRQLSHALLPVSMLGEMSVLSADRTHEFTYIPAAGYGFQPAWGSIADFRFAVDVDGEVVVDPRYAGFATASGRTLTINGYRITIDGRQLSHALLPVSMLGEMSVLSADRTHEFTYIPAAGYGFQPAWGSIADFRFAVDVDGEVVVDPRYAGVATASGRTLTINGYRITIDGRALSHDLLPVSMLDDVSVLSRDSTHELTFIPAAGYGYGFQPMAGMAGLRFDVTVDGQVVVDPRYAGVATASGRTLIIGRKPKQSAAQKVEALCRSIGIKDAILPVLAAVWRRHETREPSRNQFEGEIYTVFDNLGSEQREIMARAFAGYSELRRGSSSECLFDDGLANDVVNRPVEKAEFAAKFMQLGTAFAGQQLFRGSGGVMGPGQVRPWTKPPSGVDEVTPLAPWPWLTAIRPDGSSTNEFGNLESFIAAPGTSVEWKGEQFAQTCRFEPDVTGGIVAHCERVHPPPAPPGGLFPGTCEGGNQYQVINDCLRIPTQRAGGSIRLRGFNFITPLVKVHLQSRDHPPLTPIDLECLVWGDRERAVQDEQGKVIADLRVSDWVDVPIPSEHPDRPGSPLAPGLYDIWISVSDPAISGSPIVRQSNKLLIRIEPDDNVQFLLRSDRGRCIRESPGGGDDEIWWDAFVGHLVPSKLPLDVEGITTFRVKEITRKPFPRAPWEDMDDNESVTHICDIFGPASFELHGVVAVAIVGFEIDSEAAARNQLQGFWNAYFEAFKSIAELSLSAGGSGAVTGLSEILVKAGITEASKVALTAALVIVAYIAAITFITMGFWAVWAPADLIALDLFYLDALTAWDHTDSKKPLPSDTQRQFGPTEFDDNDVMVRVTQRALPKRGNPGESVATWVQENQYDARHDGEEFASYALEFRLTRTSV